MGNVRPILTDGDPVLRDVSTIVAGDDPGLNGVIADLAATLAAFRASSGFGRAISAPQIGAFTRVVVMDLGAGPVPIINPEVTWRSDETQVIWDDCLSVPDRIVRVKRHASISVSFEDRERRVVHWRKLPPDMAELLQHEIDHLDGVLMTDRAVTVDDVAPLSARDSYVGAVRVDPRVTAEGIRNVRALIDPVFTDSPQYECEPLSSLLGCRLTLKVETLNPIRCFKGRGASAFVQRHAEQNPGQHLVAASAGNWGQALAYSCRATGVPLVVYTAETANPLKLQRMRDLGADVRLHGSDFDAAKDEAREVAAEQGWWHAEDGFDAIVTEGHGSIAVELFEAVASNRDHLDTIVVPLGNGAMISGIARWSKAVSPATEIVGVSPEGAPQMRDAWFRPAGSDVDVGGGVDTIADGLAVRVPVPEAVDDMRGTVDDVVLVDDAAMVAAMQLLHRWAGLVTEPSGAAGVAAIAADPERFAGLHVATIISGSNLDPAAAHLLV